MAQAVPYDRPTATIWFQPTWVKLAHPSPFTEEAERKRVAAELRSVLWESAQDAGFANLDFTLIGAVHTPERLPQLAANIAAAEQAMEELGRAVLKPTSA